MLLYHLLRWYHLIYQLLDLLQILSVSRGHLEVLNVYFPNRLNDISELSHLSLHDSVNQVILILGGHPVVIFIY